MSPFTKMILNKYPDYDLNRRRYQSGDVVKTDDGAILIVDYSAIDYINAFVVRRSLSIREYGEQHINYLYLPYESKDSKYQYPLKASKSMKWEVNTVVDTDTGFRAFLYEEIDHQCFYGYVIDCPEDMQNSYKGTRIYLQNHNKDYIMKG